MNYKIDIDPSDVTMWTPEEIQEMKDKALLIFPNEIVERFGGNDLEIMLDMPAEIVAWTEMDYDRVCSAIYCNVFTDRWDLGFLGIYHYERTTTIPEMRKTV